MNEAKIAKRPTYRLLRQSDIVSFFHMQMPRWLFFNAKYIHLSLEAKVAYTFLLNRFQLSRMNGWINENGEVFLIFPREKLAEEMGISYRKAIQCFRELLAVDLIWEHRLGRGNANRIYMAAVELSETAAASHNSAPFTDNAPSKSRSTETAGHNSIQKEAGPDSTAENRSEDIDTPLEDVSNPQVQMCRNGMSEDADTAVPEVPFSHASKKENKKIDMSKKEVSQSSQSLRRDRQSDTPEDPLLLEEILEGCELYVLPEEEAGVFRNAVTRLFYSDRFRVGSAILPRAVLRSHLQMLDRTVILDTREKLRRNLDKNIKNSTAYVMATLLNNIWETKSDLMLDPYLNAIGAS